LNHPFPAQASIAAFGHFPVDASCLNDTAPELQRLVALVSMAPRSKAPEQVLGPDGQPIGVRPAKRDNKRKMPARYEDAPPSPPRRSAEKRARKS